MIPRKLPTSSSLRTLLRGVSFFAALVVSACSDPVVPGGQITVKNDIMDKDFNLIEFSASGSSGSSSGRLKPGQFMVIPVKEVRNLSFSRRYQGYTRRYEVTCPPRFNKKITMKLIDVHTNRISGGCKLTKRGIEKAGSVEWEK